MQKIRNNLVQQHIKIQNLEDKKQKKESKKFGKKVPFKTSLTNKLIIICSYKNKEN